MVNPKLIQKAKARIQSRSPNAFGIEPSNDEILKEVSSIEQENKEQDSAEEQDRNAQLESRMESSQKSRALFGDQISPELKDYAYNIFPSLNEIAPKSETQIPFAPEEEPIAQESASPESLTRQPSSIEKPKATQKAPTSPTVIAKKAEQIPQIQQPAQSQYDIEKLIKQSEEEQDRAGLWKQSAKLRDAIMGAGLGRIKQTDVSMYEDLEKKAKRPIQNLLLKQELEDKQAQRDPNSNISKLMRKSLEDLGMNMSGLEGVPYSQLEKLYPALTQGLYTKIAAEAKKEENSLRRIEKAETAAAKKENIDFNKYQKVAVGIDRLKSNMEKSDTYKSYSNANDAFIALDEALSSKDPNAKIQSSAAFMKFAKSAQGDSSVVRSEDMKVLAGGLNLSPKQLIDKFTANLEGKKFSSGELQTMKKVIQTIIDVKKKQLNKDHLQPIQKRAQANDYDLSESISPDFIRDIQGYQTPSTEEESSYTPKQEAGIKAYMESKKISREEAIKRLKIGGRL